jgi:hypothetical protein
VARTPQSGTTVRGKSPETVDALEESPSPAAWRFAITTSRNNQIVGTIMSIEFEKLAALLHLSEPSERAPQIDRFEAAKLAARWGWLVHRAREQPIETQMRCPQTGDPGPERPEAS